MPRPGGNASFGHRSLPAFKRQPRFVNLTTLLASGQYHLDDHGYLVSANGTRYRLPSGPPEGRTAVRLQPVLTPSTENYPQLADSAAVVSSNDLLESLLSNPRLLSTNATLPHLATTSSQASNQPGVVLVVAASQNVDWTTLLFTLIVGSIAVATNFALIVITSWHLCNPRQSKSKLVMSPRNIRYPGGSAESSFISMHRFSSKKRTGEVNMRQTSITLDTHRRGIRRKRRLGYRSAPVSGDEGTGAMKHGSERLFPDGSVTWTNSVKRSSRTRVKRRSQRIQDNENSSSGESPNNACYNSGDSYALSDRGFAQSDTDIRSSNAEHGADRGRTELTEATESEGDSSSVVTGVPRQSRRWIRQIGQRFNSSRHLQSGRHAIGPPSQKPRCEWPQDIHNIRSLPGISRNGMQACLSICMHVAFLGCVLSTVHLIVVCVGLTSIPSIMTDSRMNNNDTDYNSPFWQFVCLLVSSVAMDTVLCVRLHLISCFLCLAFFHALLVSQGNVSATLAALVNVTTFGISGTSAEGHTGRVKSRQQRFACLALSHSLPWALAAGSALFIALRPGTVPSQGGQLRDSRIWRYACCQLNIFFTGLHSILPSCKDSPAIPVPREEHSNPQNAFLTTLLLLFIPVAGEFLFCLPFICCLRMPTELNRSKISPSIHKLRFLTTLLFLVSSGSCLTVGVFVVLFNQASDTNPWIRSVPNVMARLSILHLALDPCLLCLIFRQLITMPCLELIPSTDNADNMNNDDVFAEDSSDLKTVLSLNEGVLPGSLRCLTACTSSQADAKALQNQTPNRMEKQAVGASKTRRDPDSSSLSDYYQKTGFLVTSYKSSVLPVSSLHRDSFVSADQMVAKSIEMHQCNHGRQTAADLSSIGGVSIAASQVSAAFPKLCQHHQHLLRQHLVQQQHTSSLQRTSGGPLFDTPLLVGVDGMDSAPPCSTGVPIGVASINSHTKQQKSAATAVVMAAAAAAVAANSRAGNTTVNQNFGQFSSPTDSSTPSTLFAFSPHDLNITPFLESGGLNEMQNSNVYTLSKAGELYHEQTHAFLRPPLVPASSVENSVTESEDVTS